ncbi:MAG: septal ring lytic transglycosylase RlpA family protein [Gammaproteobacteria bacterium]|nr:MAG: septal ring lytic transglycosylase RlpA family protein [Gammaproteobacteria bacterium]
MGIPLRATSCLLIVLLAACGGTPSKDQDSAPRNPPDVSDVPDAVPKKEPPSRYGNPESYVALGKRYYVLDSSRGYVKRGEASWYGTKFHGRRTSSGEAYNMYAMSAAHKSLPLPTYVRVTRLDNGRSVIVRVNDRGPFANGRIIDLSYAAAVKLGMQKTGTARVEVRAIDPSDRSSRNETMTSGKSGKLYMQVGAFSVKGNADAMKKRLDKARIRDVKTKKAKVDGKTVYRVRVGPVKSNSQLSELDEKLARLGITERHLVYE